MDIKEQKSMRLTQEEVHYTPLSQQIDKACASCRWFSATSEYGAQCRIMDNWPVDVLPTGLCDRWELLPMLESVPPASEQAAETAIEAVHEAIESALSEQAQLNMAMASHEDTTHETIPTPTAPTPSLFERVKAVFSKPDNSAFQVFKAQDGNHYWLARHTNIFEDRDKEILSSKAHAAYVARVNLGLVDMPELWAYHTKGTKHGQADLVWEHSGFVFALGHFDDTPEGKQAVKSYSKRKGKIELSHGFTYPKWALKDGVYNSYNTFEISTLPDGAASNPFTTFDEVTKMALNDKQSKWIKETLGEEALKRVQAAQETGEKDADVLKALDKRYKDFADLETPTEEDTKSLEISKTVGSVLGSLIAAQAELAEQLDAMKADKVLAQKAADDDKAELKSLKDQLTVLKTQLDSRPRQGSQDGATQIDPKTLPDNIKQNLTQKNAFWNTEVTP